MALTEIGARLSLAGGSRFSAAADKAGRSVRGIGEQAERADSKMNKLGRALSGFGKGAAIGGIGAAAIGVGALGTALFRGFQDAAAYQTTLAKMNATIQSTGGVAQVTARGVVGLADDLESLSGIDGNSIIDAQGMLLTFTGIRNGVGQMNHVFDQATATVVDMAAKLGSDPVAAATQLGKALNDPIKGVGALSEVGVSFTDKQKALIKSLVGSGKVMEAQKVILKELSVEFGGAAKAAGSGFEGSMARAQDAVGDLFRDLATPLLPGVTRQLERFSTYMNTTGTPSVVAFVEGFRDGEGPGGRFRDRIEEVGASLRRGAGHAQTVLTKLGELIGWMRDHENVVKGFALAVVGIKTAMMGVATYNAVAAFAGAVGALGGISRAASAARFALIGPYGLMAAVGLVAASAFWKQLSDMDSSANAVRNSLAGAPTVTTGPARPPRNNPGQGAAPRNGVNIDLSKPLYVPPTRPSRPQPGRAAAARDRAGLPPRRALGGPVRAGQPYIVGEREPELFVPGVNGDILNQRQQRTAARQTTVVPAPAAPASPCNHNVTVLLGRQHLTEVVVDGARTKAARR